VLSSSAPISREYPATSAARMAVRRRTEDIVVRRSIVSAKPTPKIGTGPSVQWSRATSSAASAACCHRGG
jgi:hypothetical protein